MYNPPAVTNHPQTVLPPIEHSEAPSRTSSVLAHVLESASLDIRPLDPILFTTEHLQHLHSSFVGKAFHIFNRGKLARRGIVTEDNRTQYVVYFVDGLTGLPTDKARVPKANTAKWKWFEGVEESNAAYRQYFKITDVEEAPSPKFVWSNRELALA
ncbi:MAG: hypothetical protein WBQ68_11945 [Terriglobales bacterium]